MNYRGFFFMLMILTLPIALFAQGLTTASINGKVTDADNNPLAGANVIATHNPSGTTFGTFSRSDGRFNLPNLRVGGPYTVEVSYIGYAIEEETDIVLSLGQAIALEFSLQEQAVILEAIEVVADENAGRTGMITRISEDDINSIPNVARSIYDFTRLSPRVNGNNIAGRHPNYNTVKIDGAVLNDVFGLPNNGLPGGQAGTQPISLDVLEEIQVSIAPYDIRQTGFTGGSIDAVTRGGTNFFKGTVYSYIRNQDFVGDFEDEVYPEFSEQIYGGSLGGPLLKDKAYFFVNAELSNRSNPNTVSLDTSDAQVFIGNTDDVKQVHDILNQKYGYDTGGYDPFDYLRSNTKLFFRLDYNITNQHRLSLRHNYVDAFDDNNARSKDRFYFTNAGYKFNNKQNSTVLHLFSSLSSKMANEFTFGYTTIRDFREPQSSEFPSIRVDSDYGTRIYAGLEQYSIGNLLDQDYMQISDNFSYFTGNHAFTLGTHNEFYRFSNGFFRNFNGFYRFRSVEDFAAGDVYSYELTYSAIEGEKQPLAEWKTNIFGIHAQDILSLGPALKLTLGIRVDIPTFPDVPAANDTVAKYFGDRGIATDQMPSGNPLIAPRFGFSYNLAEGTQLRGGIGVFSGGPKYVWLSNNFSQSGMLLKSMYSKSVDTLIIGLEDQYAAFIDPDVGYQASEIDVIDKDMKFPQVLRADVAVDQKLPFGLDGTLEFVYTKGLNELTYQELNLKDPAPGMNDGRRYYQEKVSSNFYQVMYVSNTNLGYQYGLTAQLKGCWLTSFGTTSARLSYTYSQAKDINSLTSSQARSNWRYNPIGYDTNNPELTSSLYEIPHRIMGYFSHRFEFLKSSPTTVSLFYEGRSGDPFSYIYGDDFNNDGSGENDLVYVPASEYEALIQDAEGNNVWPHFKAYVAGDPYLSQYIGEIVPRNGGREPWQNSIDLRISQKVGSPIGKDFEVTVDILNFANLLSKDWGLVKYVPYGTYSLLDVDDLEDPDNPASRPILIFDPSLEDPFSTYDLGSRWQIQIGLRYTF